MKPLTPTDWALLEFLSSEFKSLRELLSTHPPATLYRRLAVLMTRLVVKRGSTYALSLAGQRLKADHDLGERIALAARTGAHPCAGNAGPIPTFPGDSQAGSHRIPTAAQPVPARSTHERH